MKISPVVAGLFLFYATSFAEDAAPLEEESEEGGLFAGLTALIGNAGELLQTVQIPTFPALGSGEYLTTLDCDSTTRAEASCALPRNIYGVNACRKVGNFAVTVCLPEVLDNIVGAKNDVCGCCEEDGCVQDPVAKCPCSCGDGEDGESSGNGILVKHNLFTLFNRQFSWNACYTPGIARNILAARPEFSCYEGCEAGIAAAAEANGGAI